MSPAQLRQEWERVHRAAPPVGFLPDLLMRGLAYRLKEQASGPLAAPVARQLRQTMRNLQLGATSSRNPAPRTGARLTREWHGRTHHVEVVDGGYTYRERRYRSLTAIAREITGARWSGPRFFGLTSSGEDRG
jgi:hypothetical protein